MINKLTEKYQESPWDKRKNSVKQLFFGSSNNMDNEEADGVEETIKSSNEKENIFESLSLRKEFRKSQLKNEILQLIEENPELMVNMPEKKLKELDKIYDEKIQENDIKIKELQNRLQKLKNNTNKI